MTYGKDFKDNLKELKNRVIKGDTKLENGLRKLLGKPLPKDELFKKYPKLEEYYETIKNNPTDEPELDFKIEELEKTYFHDFFIEKLEKIKGFNFDNIEYDDKRLFAIKIATKIKSYEDEEGILKKIDKFNNIDFIKVQSNSIKIAKIVKKYDEEITSIKNELDNSLGLMLDGYDPDIDDPNEFEDARKKAMREYEKELSEIAEKQNSEIDNTLCEILSISRDDFSDWEFNLLKMNCLAMIGYNGYTSFMKGEL